MALDPEDFLAEGRAYEAEQKTQRRNGTGSANIEEGQFADLFQRVGEGKRNSTLTRLVGYLRAKRMDYPAGLFMARAWNEEFCAPPMDAREVEDLVSRAWVEWLEGDKEDATPEEFRSGKESRLPKMPVATPLKDRIIRFADVPFPPAELPFLWGPYLNKASVHWMTARTGLGKSTLMYNIACALAEGRTLWEIECQKARILYFDIESGQIGRSLKIQRLYRDERPDIPLHFIESVSLPLETSELLPLVQGEGYELVIFDTARRCFSVRDENDNAEFYNNIAPTLDLLKSVGVASLTLGHPAKNGNGTPRGAGAQEDVGDVNLSLSLHRGEITDADAVVKLTMTKNRILGAGYPPLFLRRIGEDQFDLAEVSEDERTESMMMQKAERVREATEELIKRGENPTVRAVAAFAKMSSRDIIKVKKYLEEANV